MIARFFGQKSSRGPDEEARILRKLSPNECFQSAQHLLRIYIGCALSCRYVIPEALLALDTDSFKHAIESAFARAILQHPALTVGRIDDNTKSPLWVRLDRIDFNNHITWSGPSEDTENSLSEVLERQVNDPYLNLERQPCWRAVILQLSGTKFMDVVFAWDHSAGDGKSGKIFHDTFLACLNTPESNSITLENRSFDVPATPHTPPMGQLIDLPISLGYIVSELSREFLPQLSAKPHTATWAPIFAEPAKTRLSWIRVTKEAFPSVLDACRMHETTLTALLNTLLMVSIATRLSEDTARAFSCGTPICFRQFQVAKSDIDCNKTVMNCYAYWPFIFEKGLVSTIRQRFSDAKANPDLDSNLEDALWDVARTIREGLLAKLSQGTKNDTVGLAKFIGDWPSYFKGLSKTREHAFELSNLGVIQGRLPENGDGEGKWSIDGASFAQSSPSFGAALTLNVIQRWGIGYK
ncbi:uncharacterized protein FPRO_11254 [Fusarium proliferatum ET1]|uniref:Alcohol acetyltransferase n=1 Tax=Fusarium proliferatum (strain ET1) TaxID=1227346 RepID=A0A1L7VMK2_FUSPR|nr:uncharacterized protein FPRO_11254 [Fusarium proliferatum ET1]CZR41664.1 uncharacterized protein FPRO_11254 [Fusarium proliferatum ET1]